MREKVELRGVGAYSDCDTKAQVAERMLRDLCDIEPTQAQIKQAEALLIAQLAEFEALAHGRGPITIDAVGQPIGQRPRLR